MNDWIQLAGTLLAIGGAAAFPYMHEDARRKKDEESRRKVLLLLAWNLRVDIGRLREVLSNAVTDFGEISINQYIELGYHLEWAPNIEALQSLPIAELSPQAVDFLGKLKVAAAFSAGVVARLDNWQVTGDREMGDMRRLDYYYESCVRVIDLIDPKLSEL
nr:hypothetical protein [uncultured Pseudomonas sp.]